MLPNTNNCYATTRDMLQPSPHHAAQINCYATTRKVLQPSPHHAAHLLNCYAATCKALALQPSPHKTAQIQKPLCGYP
jgi:hypothetical protein